MKGREVRPLHHTDSLQPMGSQPEGLEGGEEEDGEEEYWSWVESHDELSQVRAPMQGCVDG